MLAYSKARERIRAEFCERFAREMSARVCGVRPDWARDVPSVWKHAYCLYVIKA